MTRGRGGQGEYIILCFAVVISYCFQTRLFPGCYNQSHWTQDFRHSNERGYVIIYLKRTSKTELGEK